MRQGQDRFGAVDVRPGLPASRAALSPLGCRSQENGKGMRIRDGHGYAESVLRRFWRRVTRRDPWQCWLWTGGTRNGYGALWISEIGRDIGAHRFSYKIHNGQIPSGILVCHSCDVRACVNPRHLFLGAAQDNLDDMRAKERGPGRRITPEIVAQVEALRGRPGREIGPIVGISPQSVWRILSGQRVGIPGEARESPAEREKRHRTRVERRAAKLGQPRSPVVPPAGLSGSAESGPDSSCPISEAFE